jgi:hypothetical protein
MGVVLWGDQLGQHYIARLEVNLKNPKHGQKKAPEILQLSAHSITQIECLRTAQFGAIVENLYTMVL